MNAKPVTTPTDEDGHMPNPYQPTLAHNEIARPMIRRFLGWSIIPPVFACAYGLYHSWTPLLFAGVIVVGIPITLLGLVLNEKERINNSIRNVIEWSNAAGNGRSARVKTRDSRNQTSRHILSIVLASPNTEKGTVLSI